MMAIVLAGCEGGRGGGGLGGPCDGLALAECRVTDGCTPDLCPGCFCDQSYRGCLGSNVDPLECPQLGCPGALCCTTEAQCNGQGSCTQPGTPMGCGACNPEPGDCLDDSQCTGTDICEPIQCSCDGVLACAPGCIDGQSCDDGTMCDGTTNRCVALACTVDDDCPADFQCDPGGCTRRTCTDDLACDGFCVLGSCFSARGECRLPVP